MTSIFKEHNMLNKNELPQGCLGYKDDLTEKEWSGKEICGVSGLVFETRKSYLNHTSPVTGFKPTQIEHQDALTGGQASRVAEKALERGEARKKELNN